MGVRRNAVGGAVEFFDAVVAVITFIFVRTERLQVDRVPLPVKR
jgi:hypothetical protein